MPEPTQMPTPLPTPLGSSAPQQQEEGEISVLVYVSGDPTLTVPLAGLLADDPTLASTQLTATQWRQKLADYLQSPRP
jgi:hypothetical protein